MQTTSLQTMPNPAEYYGVYYPHLVNAAEILTNYLSAFRRHCLNAQGADPIDHVLTRIKTPGSAMAKLERKHYPTDGTSAVFNIHDAIGVRIVCPMLSDIDIVKRALECIPTLEVVTEKDYIRFPKPNGYRSYHMIVRIRTECEDRTRSTFVEIQLRTIAMDCWAALEHQLKYKRAYEGDALIAGELRRCADELAATDHSLLAIRENIEASKSTCMLCS